MGGLETWRDGVDQVAVDRLVTGAVPLPDPDSLTEEEQHAAALRFPGAAGVIAGRVGVSERTVVRWRRAAGWEAPGEC